MVLDFEYGINTGNRFLDLVDHDEDPDEYIARQTQPEEKPKKSTKDSKTSASTTTTKKTTAKTTTTATASTQNVSGNTTKTNKENLSGKSANTDQRRQQSNVLADNNNQQTRNDSGRGGGRGNFRRGGGSAGQDRPPYEGGQRGGGQQRSQRFNKFDDQQSSNQTSGFEQGGDAWGTETGNDNQTFSGHRGRGRGRGNYEGGRGRGNYEGGRGRGNYEGGRGRGNFEGGRGGRNYEGGRGGGNFEGGRGGGRGRGRGGRGNFSDRNFEESSQQQQQQPAQESNEWQQSTESNFDNTRTQSARTAGEEGETDVPIQERPFEAGSQRGGRGFRSRTFHNNRNYGGSDRRNQYDRDSGEGGQDDQRHNRRLHDRQQRSYVSGVKSIEKKDGEGAHNWGNSVENPEDHPVPDDVADPTGQAAPASKDWAQQVDEAEKQMTLDEYKKQKEEKKRANLEKLPQFNRRAPGEGEDPKAWRVFEQEYRKKNEGDASDEEELEEADDEDENEEENDDEQTTGKKKVITIPLRFKPIEIPRGGSAGSRGGPRRGTGGRYRDRPTRDDQQSSTPASQQQPSVYQQTGEYQNDDQQQQQQQSRPYRGGSRPGPGRNEYRRSYSNSARGSRGGYNRSSQNPYTPDLDNTVDFPTLPKQ